MSNQSEAMLRANLEKLTEDLQKPIITLSDEFKLLSKQVDDIARGMVALSAQMDIQKDWLIWLGDNTVRTEPTVTIDTETTKLESVSEPKEPKEDKEDGKDYDPNETT